MPRQAAQRVKTMRTMVLFFGLIYLITGFCGGVELLNSIVPVSNELTKDGVLAITGLTWVAIYVCTE